LYSIIIHAVRRDFFEWVVYRIFPENSIYSHLLQYYIEKIRYPFVVTSLAVVKFLAFLPWQQRLRCNIESTRTKVIQIQPVNLKIGRIKVVILSIILERSKWLILKIDVRNKDKWKNRENFHLNNIELTFKKFVLKHWYLC